MTPSPGEPRLFTGPAGRALGILTAVHLVAHLDRFVVAALVGSLRADLWLTDARLGWLLSAFVVVHVAASPAFGALGDRRRRPRLVALGAALLGVAALLSAAARGYGALLAARAAAGIGQAASGTVSPGLLADHLGPERRGRGRAFLAGAAVVGAALGYAAGGIVDRTLGWRAAFVAAAAPALLLALACLAVADPLRGASRGTWTAVRGEGGVAAACRRLLPNRRFVLAVAGHAAHTFAVAGVAFWLPAFLERARGVPRVVATVELGAIVVMTGFAGSFAGGFVADALRRRVREADLWVCGVATLAAAPLALVAFSAYRPGVYLVALVLAQLLLFASTGPASAAIAGAVPPAERASAAAVSFLAIRLLGDAPAPVLVGFLSDRSSLGWALLAVPAALLAAGLVWTFTAWRGERAARSGAARGDRARRASP